MPKTLRLSKRLPLKFRYVDTKDRKMMSVRLPEALIDRLKKVSAATGYSATELTQAALDFYLQKQVVLK